MRVPYVQPDVACLVRDRRATWLGMRQTPRDLTRSTLSPSPSIYALLPLLTLFFLLKVDTVGSSFINVYNM